MTRLQKKTLAMTSLGVIVVLSLSIISLAALAITNRLVGDEGVGQLFLELSANFADLGIMLKVLCGMILTGIGILGATYRSGKSIGAMTGFLLASIVASIILLIAIGRTEVAADLWGPSKVVGTQSFEELQATARPLILWAGGAFCAMLAAFLGISAVKGVSHA